MAAISVAHVAHHNTFHTYLENVGKAGRAFLAALIAFEFSPATVAKASEKSAAVADVSVHGQYVPSMLSLYRVASQSDSVRPELVDEMRLLAAREVMKRRRQS